MDTHTRRADLIPSALAWLAMLPLLWWSMTAAPQLWVDIGEWGDHALLQHANGPEQSSTETYRWTTDLSTLIFPNLGPAYRLLVFRAHGWRPDGPSPAVELGVDGRPFGVAPTTANLRVYRVLLPESEAADRSISFTTALYRPPGDTRAIGIALDWAALRAVGSRWRVGIVQGGGQALLMALVFALVFAARRTMAGRLDAWGWLALLGAASAVIAMNIVQPLWIALALGPWLVLACVLLLAEIAVGARTRAWLQGWMSPRQAAWAWVLLVAASALRLLGATHPFFDSHDLPVHDRWMRIVAAGQLYLYSTPGELQNRLTFNPPAGYLLLLPGWLAAPDLRLVIQAGTALLDAFGCVLLLPVARYLRVPGRAALIALGLYAALPINMTMLWWGFVTNDIAQTVWLALLWAILRLEHDASKRAIAFVAVAAAACVMTHVGALVLVAVMLAVLAASGLLLMPRPAWRALIAGLAAAVLFTLPIYFSAAAMPVLMQPPNPQARSLAESLARGLSMLGLRIDFVRRAYALGYAPVVLAALPAGFVLWWYMPRRHAMQRVLLGALAAVSVGFAAVYVLLGFLTRYVYFVAPFVCLAAGLLLARLWQRPWGKALVITLVACVAFSGAALWFSGVLLRDKPSLVPLTQ